MISLYLPEYFNYGGIGGVIGHEMMHSFDNNGVSFDKNGAEADWWSKEARIEFNKRVKCIIEQYDNYVHPKLNLRVSYLKIDMSYENLNYITIFSPEK